MNDNSSKPYEAVGGWERVYTSIHESGVVTVQGRKPVEGGYLYRVQSIVRAKNGRAKSVAEALQFIPTSNRDGDA
jgi:hypothetical protein